MDTSISSTTQSKKARIRKTKEQSICYLIIVL